MIRRRDQIRLSVQKIGLRKKRAAFSVISVALGIVIVVTVNSLVHGVRDLVIRTGFTEEIDPDVVQVSNEPRYSSGDDLSAPRRVKFITQELLAKFQEWDEVEAAVPMVTVRPVSVEGIEELPRAAERSFLTGVPEVLIRRYATAQQLAACDRVIPLVVGERFVKLRYNDKTKKFDLEDPSQAQAWIGRELTLRIGDPTAPVGRFRYELDTKQWHRMSEEELAQRRQTAESYDSSEYDGAILKRMLPLRARVVGFCPGARLLIPEEPARLCAKWLKQREALARLRPAPEPESDYGPYGRRRPREGEFSQAILVLKAGSDAEAVVKRLRDMGLEGTTRQNAFESFLKEVETAMKIVKRIAYAFGGVLLMMACGLLWSTTSRIVSDSRVDIGLFRALGATKSDVRRLFLTETILLGELGTVAGILLGWAAAFWISRLVIYLAAEDISDPVEMLMIPRTVFAIDWVSCGMLVVGAAVVSWLAGVWPANRAANIDPVKALKRE